MNPAADASENQGPRPFGPGSMLWDDVGDVLFSSLTLPAFMLQAMHPTISAAVDRHSVFRTDPLGRAIRSADSVMLWIYGGEEAIAEGKRLRRLHKSIRGTDDEGTRYSALDPEAYAWVHGTAFVTAVLSYPYARGRRLTETEEEALYAEMLELGEILRVPSREMPQTRADYWNYYATTVSERLERTLVADDILAMLAAPPIQFLPRPLNAAAWPARKAIGHALYLLMFGPMTDDARKVLGVRWSAANDAELRSLMAVARPVHGRLPERLRYLPLAAHARRKARSVEAIRRRAIETAPAAAARHAA